MNECKVEGCTNKARSLGYCIKHYRRLQRTGSVELSNKLTNEYELHDNYVELKLVNKQGEHHISTYVSLDKLDKVRPHKWRLGGKGYVQANIDGKITLIHRFILDAPDNILVDHVDQNKLNNTNDNLRFCTSSENNINTKLRSDNSSGVRGVSLWKGKWRACINKDKKRYNLGTYDKIEDAIIARKEAEKKFHGEFTPIV